MDRTNPRTPEADVSPLFTDRWSPRSFSPQEVSTAQLQSLFEAARWAPSCYNDQPAVFVFARTAEDRARFAEALVEGNRAWAKEAPVLMFVLARRPFSHNGKLNRWAPFDAGAAWMSLALQARMLGLHTHAMAGFSTSKAEEVLGVDPDEYDVMAAVALGYRASPDLLPEEMAQREGPNERRVLEQVAFEASMPRG